MNNTKNNPKNNSSPFQILDINPSANKKEILKQVTIALKKRHYDAKRIVQAQKLLFNPVSRAVEEFLYYLSFDTMHQSKIQATSKQTRIFDNNYPIPELLNFDNKKTTT